MGIDKIIRSCLIASLLMLPARGNEKTEPLQIDRAEQLLAANVQLIDVRTKEEWDESHLKGAKLVTVTEDDFLAKAVLDPEKEVLVYCRSGKRSAIAAEKLRAAGYAVHEISGGITAWVEAGKPVEKGTPHDTGKQADKP
ncbi:rhodanese-like domain-containing protein [Akkermansiaceae bacterium]|nr:rhodanese-like domain-containing protein [Akkermansiaceae bacterium]